MSDEAGPAGPAPEDSPATEPRQPLSLTHPAAIIATLLAALCVLLSVTFTIYDPDIWQHLAVGRAIWQLHRVPATQIWIWPTYGVPDITPSWVLRECLRYRRPNLCLPRMRRK